MRIKYVFKGTREELRLNPNTGTFSWFLHRITGLLLLFYLFTHLWVLGSANKGMEMFNYRLASVQTPLFHFLEIGLILVVFYHSVLGFINGHRVNLTGSEISQLNGRVGNDHDDNTI